MKHFIGCKPSPLQFKLWRLRISESECRGMKQTPLSACWFCCVWPISKGRNWNSFGAVPFFMDGTSGSRDTKWESHISSFTLLYLLLSGVYAHARIILPRIWIIKSQQRLHDTSGYQSPQLSHTHKNKVFKASGAFSWRNFKQYSHIYGNRRLINLIL